MAAGAPAPGARVLLQGLSRAELNGRVAIVLEPDDEAEAAQLREAERLKVSHYPKALALRLANLAPAPPPDFATPPLPFIALEIVRQDPSVATLCKAAAEAGEDLAGIGAVGGFDDPEGFAEALWQVYSAVPPAGAMPKDLEALVLDSPGHWLYWLGLEQVGHHLLIEACDGVWRGYQALARAPGEEAADRGFESFGGILLEGRAAGVPRGYTARAWAAAVAGDETIAQGMDAEGGAGNVPLGLPEPAAYTLWGGGRDLTRAEVACVLVLVRRLQELAQPLAAKLREQVREQLGAPADAAGEDGSGVADAAAAAWARARLEAAEGWSQGPPARALSLTPDRPGSPRSGPGYAEADLVWLFSAPGIEPACDLSLPTGLAFPFMRTFAGLTGEYPSGHTFLSLLEFSGWQTLEREDGGRTGWTFRALDLRRR